MPVLSDNDIKRLTSENMIHILPFDARKLTPNGYDLTIDELLIPVLNDRRKHGKAKVPHLAWFVVSTKEYIKLGAKVCGQLWIKSSWARRGVIASFGKVDSGFEGNLILSAFNASGKELEVQIGATFAQISFETLLSEPEFLYGRKGSSYQRQRGIRL
jgi:dCTP deaminase